MKINDSLPDFTLKGTDDKTHSASDYAGKDAVVIIFTCNHCPYARAYVQRISELVEKYEKRNVGFYAISANDARQYPEDSFENMIPMGKRLNLHGKYLYDESQETTLAFGAQRTPEVFVFDNEKRLAYRGAIDDNYEKADAVKNHFLRDAIDAALTGGTVAEKETKPTGCSIKWKPGVI